MSNEYKRYAVYWVPKRNDPLARFGVSWTGWCAEHGEPRERGSFRDTGLDAPAITRELCNHGLHAVIKAPFELGAERSRFSLEHTISELAERNVMVTLPRFDLAVVQGRVALVPQASSPSLSALIARIDDAVEPMETGVVAVDAYQLEAVANGFAEASAPAPALKMDKFGGSDALIQLPASAVHRFHIPLTDQLELESAFEVKEQLGKIVAPMLDEPRVMRDLALMCDPGGGRPLRVLQRYELRDKPLRKASSALPCQGPHVLVPTLDGHFVNTDVAI